MSQLPRRAVVPVHQPIRCACTCVRFVCAQCVFGVCVCARVRACVRSACNAHLHASQHATLLVCVHVCVHVCVRACMHACVRACVPTGQT
jgi:hypothetical protein